MADGPPAKVVINEYLDVARGFFTGAEPRLANGVLDRLARRCGRASSNDRHTLIGTLARIAIASSATGRRPAPLVELWRGTNQPGPPRAGVKGAVAANGDVYVLCRAAHPVLVFDAEGRFVSSWGEGQPLEFGARADN